MSNFSIVSSDLSRLHARFSDGAIDNTQAALALQVGSDSNVHCPEDTSQMRNSMEPASDFKNGNIVWDTDYASDVYNADETSIKTSKNPLARPRWFEVAKEEHLDEWKSIVEEGLGK
ncbi:MAG: minor capsid protein [Gordonibacter sp.]|uniref:minor capsid protein n=1 Tax=Gordonibacter sp. TaxID=1968902 RepID=UPI002FCA1C73